MVEGRASDERGPDEPGSGQRAIGWREVILVAAAAVLCVLAVAALALFVPAVGNIFQTTPLTVIVIVGATVLVLWRIAARRTPEP